MPKENKKNKSTPARFEKQMPIGFHIEIDKTASGLSVCVNGASSVLDFCEECAVLKLHRGRLRVAGHGLSISVYENKIAEISGKVGLIEFI